MTTINPNISEADVKRIQADGFEFEAKKMRRSVKRVPVGDPKGDVTRAVANYLEGRAESLRLTAEALEVKSEKRAK